MDRQCIVVTLLLSLIIGTDHLVCLAESPQTPDMISGVSAAIEPPVIGKTASVLFPAELMLRARDNARTEAWAARARDEIMAAAEPWLQPSDDELWDLMFSNSIERSWMVWSNGHCPACQQAVPMYEWVVDALQRPWTVQCPRCQDLFPKNDFLAFYRSGLDQHGLFDPARADRSLLVNVEHPDPDDPLHTFGVDDGAGYVAGEHRWRFIGAYLIYGQWKQAIVGGINRLAAAYVVSGEPAYAHKAGILLDRVADLYPTFDFGREGVMYEGPPHAGYVSTWHDACAEAYDLATAYDAVFDALAQDKTLVTFLAAQASRYQLENHKSSFAEIQRNIEERILRDTVAQRHKIESNYPTTDITIATILTVLDWPQQRDEVTAILDGIIQRATAVDGLSGEKGIAGYSAIAPRTIADLLARYQRVDPGFIAAALERHPQLHAMYRFHLDTWCLGAYYPCIGDTGAFAQRFAQYAALDFSRSVDIDPSAFTFLWDLYTATGDQDFVRTLYAANDHSTEDLPHDLCAADPSAMQQEVARIVAKDGPDIRLGSVNKSQWCLAILRSGAGADERAVWLDYDSGGGHGHADALNLGLFAKGLDLMPDFGYPPVQYGGWSAPRAVWYTQTAAHNTVVVDGQNSRPGAGTMTLWADASQCRVMRASAAALIGGPQFERTVAMIDVSEQDVYLVDIFRVVGGREHVKFVHGHFGRMTTPDLAFEAVEETAWGPQMRNFQQDLRPKPLWNIDWVIDDHLRYLPAGQQLHMRYTDLTPDVEVLTAEGWVAVGLYGGTAEAWIPRLLVRRRADQAPLASTFLSVIEPYEREPGIAGMRRLPLETTDGRACGDSDVALEIQLADGRRDVLIALDVEDPRGMAQRDAGPVRQPATGIRLDGQLCVVRFDAAGKPRHAMLCRGRSLEVNGITVPGTGAAEWIDVALDAPVSDGGAHARPSP